jgi:hypothetical protein
MQGGSVLSLFELHGRGKSIKEICRELGVSRNAVRKYLRLREVPEQKLAPARPSVLDPYKEKVLELVKKGLWNCVVILWELRQLGYTGGFSILKEFVHPFRALRQPEAVMRSDRIEGAEPSCGLAGARRAGPSKHAAYALFAASSPTALFHLPLRQRHPTITRRTNWSMLIAHQIP